MPTPLYPFLAVFLLKLGVPTFFYLAVFFGFLFCHYFLALVALRKRKMIGSRIPVVFTIVLALSTALFMLGAPIDIYFGIHWLFGEIYLTQHEKATFWMQAMWLSTYYFLNYTTLGASFFFQPEAFFISLFIFIALSLILILIDKSSNQRKALKVITTDSMYFLFTGLLLVSGSTNFIDIIFIHLFQFGIAYAPPSKQSREWQRYMLSSVGLTVLFIGLFHPLSPIYLGGLNILDQAVFFGFIHRTQSFFLSRLNPGWIQEYFVRPWFARLH